MFSEFCVPEGSGQRQSVWLGSTRTLEAWGLCCNGRPQPIKLTAVCCCVQENVGKRRGECERSCGGGDNGF